MAIKLPHAQIIRKFDKLNSTYEELANEYNTSKGTIWRILKQHDMLRHRAKKAIRTERDREKMRGDIVNELLNKMEEMDVLEYLEMVPTGKVKLVVTSPPYNIGKKYESQVEFVAYRGWMEQVLSEVYRVLDKNGALFLNVGNFVDDGTITPLDSVFIPILKELGFKIRNRNIWHFRHGLHCKNRFSGRHEAVIFATKSDDYDFNLDSIRVPQLNPAKRYYKGPKRGHISSNPKGKNPGDVWDIANVKHNHPEKFTSSTGETHPCQFPTEIPRIAVLACTDKGDIVLDPFMGAGTTAVVCQETGRIFMGSDTNYTSLARERLALAKEKLERVKI